jgi:hypothetical protein
MDHMPLKLTNFFFFFFKAISRVSEILSQLYLKCILFKNSITKIITAVRTEESEQSISLNFTKLKIFELFLWILPLLFLVISMHTCMMVDAYIFYVLQSISGENCFPCHQQHYITWDNEGVGMTTSPLWPQNLRWSL